MPFVFGSLPALASFFQFPFIAVVTEAVTSATVTIIASSNLSSCSSFTTHLLIWAYQLFSFSSSFSFFVTYRFPHPSVPQIRVIAFDLSIAFPTAVIAEEAFQDITDLGRVIGQIGFFIN